MNIRDSTFLTAFGCSILSPSSNHRSCCDVICRASDSFLGHWNRPCSNRLYRSRNPSPSQNSALSRVLLLPQNRNRLLEHGSSLNTCVIVATSPSIERRISVYPTAKYTHSAGISFRIITLPTYAVRSPPFPRQLRYVFLRRMPLSVP